MKRIKLTQGKVALIDNEDFERVSKYKWLAHRTRNNLWYVEHHNYKGETLYLHRFIMNLPKNYPKVVDHINKNTLDNRKNNLRICSQSENNLNRRGWGKTSKYRNVHFSKRDKVFKVTITRNKKLYYFGSFKNEEDALHASLEGLKNLE